MSSEFNIAVEKDIVPEILEIRERYLSHYEESDSESEMKSIMNRLLACSKEQLTELLKAKRIDKELVEYVASEDDPRVIARVIKMVNRFIPFSHELVSYAQSEEKMKILDATCDYIFAHDAYGLYSGMTIEQMNEVLFALKSGVKYEKIKWYMLNLSATQMRQMTKAIKTPMSSAKLRCLYDLANGGMPADQLREIRKCLEWPSWDEDKIQWLVSKKFCKEQLFYVRKTYEYTSNWNKTVFIANPQFDSKKMSYIEEAFECGLSIQQVKPCVSFDTRMCRDMIKRLQLEKLNKII